MTGYAAMLPILRVLFLPLAFISVAAIDAIGRGPITAFHR
jgi:hypothetical protein